MRQLRDVARWTSRRGGGEDRIRDVKSGFAGGRQWLVQARPPVRFRSSALLEAPGALAAAVREGGAQPLALLELS